MISHDIRLSQRCYRCCIDPCVPNVEVLSQIGLNTMSDRGQTIRKTRTRLRCNGNQLLATPSESAVYIISHPNGGTSVHHLPPKLLNTFTHRMTESIYRLSMPWAGTAVVPWR